ncbi:MAG: hypothetical protein FWD88_02860 [Treponema sp.]|nr:hypothetical protein [Treponema sp.]
MPRFANRRYVARLVFIIGLIFMFLGSTFLTGGSPMGISQASVHVSFLLVVLGVGCAFAAFRLNRCSLYLFSVALFFQAGLFFLLCGIGVLPLELQRIWPLLSVFAGVAILPTGWYRYRAIRVNYVVLAAAFVILGSVLMIFSLEVVAFPFSQFVLDWWPLLVVLAALALLLAALGSRLAKKGRK